MPKTTFSLLRALNGAPDRARSYGGASHVFPSKIVEQYFSSSRLIDSLIRDLVLGHVIRWKEILESFEFFSETRKVVRSASMADVCCGHGLTGILFALLEKSVEQVRLIDESLPASTVRVLETAIQLGPWVKEKVSTTESGLTRLESSLPDGTAVLAVHGCGSLTDQALDLAMEVAGPVAVMPCCCHPRLPGAPPVLFRELGVKDGVDVHRTYRLSDAGYHVRWRYVPEDITPMNRIILATRR
ncbi:methyltransferase [Candidatus Latescibacterota bacterium]